MLQFAGCPQNSAKQLQTQRVKFQFSYLRQALGSKPVVLGGSWDLVSKVTSTVVGICQ